MTKKSTQSNIESAVEKHYWRAVTFLLTLILIGTAFWGVRRFNPALFLGKPDFIAVPNQELPEQKQIQPSENKQESSDSNPPSVISPSTVPNQETAEQKQIQPDKDKPAENKPAPSINGNPATVEEPQTSPSTAPDQETAEQKEKPPPKDKLAPLNINTATVEDLQEFPGIGPKTAQRIVEYREQHGNFRSVDALMEVRGIGEKTLEKLEPFIGVE